jgi:hypothetical protein
MKVEYDLNRNIIYNNIELISDMSIAESIELDDSGILDYCKGKKLSPSMC